MTIDRRNFLKVSASGAALAAVASTPVLGACTSTASKGNCRSKQNPFKLSFQEGTTEIICIRSLIYGRTGVVGYEPGGFGLKDQVKEIQDALKGEIFKSPQFVQDSEALFFPPKKVFGRNV